MSIMSCFPSGGGMELATGTAPLTRDSTAGGWYTNINQLPFDIQLFDFVIPEYSKHDMLFDIANKKQYGRNETYSVAVIIGSNAYTFAANADIAWGRQAVTLASSYITTVTIGGKEYKRAVNGSTSYAINIYIRPDNSVGVFWYGSGTSSTRTINWFAVGS